MRFIVDENLPARAAQWLAGKGYDAHHVSDLGLTGRPDADIWTVACGEGAFVVSRDADFIVAASRSIQSGVVRLAIGNCSTAVRLARLEALWPDVERRLAAGERIIELG
jgi:predicted nuclease of predicted toxin-antitoxin system